MIKFVLLPIALSMLVSCSTPKQKNNNHAGCEESIYDNIKNPDGSHTHPVGTIGVMGQGGSKKPWTHTHKNKTCSHTHLYGPKIKPKRVNEVQKTGGLAQSSLTFSLVSPDENLAL